MAEADLHQELTEYLLGRLPEAGRENLENRYVADEDLYQELLIAEHDLIDEYVMGDLTDAARRDFEAAYLASERRKRLVDFSRALLQRAGSPREWPMPRSRILAMAAVLLIAVLGAWWALRFRPSAGRVAGTPQVQRVPIPVRPPSIFAVALAPGLLRGETQKQVAIPRDADQVRLELMLDATAAREYRASLRTAEGREVWSSIASPPNSSAVLPIVIPAEVLVRADYVLRLSVPGSRGKSAPAAEYFFRVTGRAGR